MKIFFALLLASVSIVSSSAEDETFVWNEQTPIYYPEIIEGTMKIIKTPSSFTAKKAANSGNPNALFPRILIFTDYPNFQKKNETRLKTLARNVMESINANFSKIKTDRPVEALMAGLVIIKEPGIYDGTPTISVMGSSTIQNNPLAQLQQAEQKTEAEALEMEWDVRRGRPEMKALSDWMRDHEDQFEDLHAHIYFYLSRYWMIDDTEDVKNGNMAMGLADLSKEICSSKPIMIVGDSLGNSHLLYAITFSYTMGLRDPRDKPVLPYFSFSHWVEDDKLKEWQDKVVETVNKMDREDKYACFKDSDYDDN